MRALVLAITVAIAGCGTAPQASAIDSASAQRAVYVAKSGYAATLTVAVAYKKLPQCSVTVRLPCSDATIVAQLQRADKVTAMSLDAAEAAVRTPALSAAAITDAVNAANAALAAFTSITTNLRVTP